MTLIVVCFQSCPGCSSPLVLFNEKFGEVRDSSPREKSGDVSDSSPREKNSGRRESSERNPATRENNPSDKNSTSFRRRPGRSPQQDNKDGIASRKGHKRDSSGEITAGHGGWYCSRCGVHIIPDVPTVSVN